MSSSFVGHARTIGGLTLVSRVLGLVRDTFSSNIFGAGAVWDAFSIAFLVPNLFRRLFGEGALTSAFVPVFVDYFENKGRDEAQKLLRATVTAMVVVLGLTLVAAIGATYALPLIPGMEKHVLTLDLTRLMLPYMLLVCVTAILGAALNSLHHFASPAAAPVVLNVVLIAGFGVAFYRTDLPAERRIFFPAVAVLVGGLLEQALQYPALRAKGLSIRPHFDFKHPGLREVGAIFIPATLGVGLIQINELVDRVIAAAYTDAGGVSALYYSDRFIFLPISIIGTALGVASLPALSREAARGDDAGFSRALGQALRGVFFLSIPATVGVLLIPDLLIGTVFEHGEFKPEHTARTARVLFYYGISLWAYAGTHILTRAFYARKDAATPFRVMGAMVFLNLALNLILVRTPLKEAGLALATSISGVLNLVTLTIVLRRKHGLALPPDVVRTGLLSALLAAATIPLLLYLRGPLFETLPLIPKALEVIRLASCVGAAMLVYFGLSWLLQRAEIKALLGRDH